MNNNNANIGIRDWETNYRPTYGLETNTGGRIAKIKNYIEGDFIMTYGDGLADVDINKLTAGNNISIGADKKISVNL